MAKHLDYLSGCLTEILSFLEGHGVKPVVRDERLAGRPIEVEFHGILRPPQEEAVSQILRHDDGLICAPTAFGKTAVAAYLIAKRKVNTLVMVHRQQLLDQWRERLAMFLEMPIDQIGQIGGGKTKRTGNIDVAVIQSLHRDQEVKDFVAEYGHVIVDECHHLSAFTFERVMRSQGQVVIGYSGDTNPQRRASPNHLHAVRTRSVQPGSSRDDGFDALRTHRHSAFHGFSNGRRQWRSLDSGHLCRACHR